MLNFKITPYRLIITLFALLQGSLLYPKDHLLSAPEKIKTPTISYDAYESLLSIIVLEGRVDYKKLKKHKGLLKAAAESFQTISKEQFEKLSKGSSLAYWINLYHLIVLKTIAENYPVSSFLDIKTHTKSAFEIAYMVIMGKKYTLDVILHEIIRPKYSDPRIHCLLSYGAISSPRFYPHAFKGSDIATKLHEACIEFVNDPSKNKVNNRQILISKIFQWYPDDFLVYHNQKTSMFKNRDNKEKAFLSFIYKHLRKDSRRYIKRDKLPLSYLDFNWDLNDIEPATP